MIEVHTGTRLLEAHLSRVSLEVVSAVSRVFDACTGFRVFTSRFTASPRDILSYQLAD